MLLLILVAILAVIAFGLGFVVHWLFIGPVVLALIWLISRSSLVGRKRFADASGGPLRAARPCATVEVCRGPRSSSGFSP